jgi:antitoxin CcdA
MGKTELKIEIDTDLLAQAQAAGMSLADITESIVRELKRASSDEAKARQWAEDNAEAIKAHRERIDAYGVFGEDLRTG